MMLNGKGDLRRVLLGSQADSLGEGRGEGRAGDDAPEGKQDVVATAACHQAGRGACGEARDALLGAAAAAHSCGQNRAGSGAVLVAGAALRPARWLLGLDQRHHRAAVQCWIDDQCLARPHSGHTDRRGAGFFLFIIWYASVELYSGGGGCGGCLRTAGAAQQFAAGRRHHHHCHAGTKDGAALEPGIGPRGPSGAGHFGGPCRDHAGVSRSRAATAPRRPGAGVPGAGRVLRGHSAGVQRGARGEPACAARRCAGHAAGQ